MKEASRVFDLAVAGGHCAVRAAFTGKMAIVRCRKRLESSAPALSLFDPALSLSRMPAPSTLSGTDFQHKKSHIRLSGEVAEELKHISYRNGQRRRPLPRLRMPYHNILETHSPTVPALQSAQLIFCTLSRGL